jgi:hypothetical protein
MKDSVLGAGFKYGLYIKDARGAWVQDGDVECNIIPQVGVNHIASLLRGSGATPISSWFMGLFEGNYVPTSGVTAADLPGVVGESGAYSESSRPAWNHQYDGVSVIDNTASLATFTMDADKRIYGAFIVSSNTKQGNGGVLLSIARFATPRDLTAGQEFGVGGVLTLIPTSF